MTKTIATLGLALLAVPAGWAQIPEQGYSTAYGLDMGRHNLKGLSAVEVIATIGNANAAATDIRAEAESELHQAGLGTQNQENLGKLRWSESTIPILGISARETNGSYTVNIVLHETVKLDRFGLRVWVDTWRAEVTGSTSLQDTVRREISEFVNQWRRDNNKAPTLPLTVVPPSGKKQ